MTKKLYRLSATIKNVGCLIELDRSVMNMMKVKALGQPYGTPEVTWKGKEDIPETRKQYCLFSMNYETS
jgi:hypothetical protein